MSANNEIRLAQLIQAFGPGALVDLPDKSVMIKGLSGWPLKSGNREMRRIEEPRLVNYLTSLLRLGADGISWLEDGVTLSLYEPPLKDSSPVNFGKSAVPAVIYPRWQIIVDPDDPSRQRLERYTSGEKAKSKKGVVRTPVRWLAACKKGISMTSIGEISRIAAVRIVSRQCFFAMKVRAATRNLPGLRANAVRPRGASANSTHWARLWAIATDADRGSTNMRPLDVVSPSSP